MMNLTTPLVRRTDPGLGILEVVLPIIEDPCDDLELPWVDVHNGPQLLE